MKKTGRKQSGRREERPLFDSIRKPAAAPGHLLSRAKPEGRAHPAGRKVKHTRRPGDGD